MSKAFDAFLKCPFFVPSLAGDVDIVPAAQTPRASEIEFDHRDFQRAQTIFLLSLPQMNDYGHIVPDEEEKPVEVIVERPTQDIVEKTVPKLKPIQKKYTLQERITQAQNGAFILNCIEAATQDLTKGLTDFQNQDGKFEFTIKKNYLKLENGSLEMVNQWLLKKQKQVLGYLIKQFGSAIMSGKSIMSISLPITISEPRSLLERLADSFVFAPHFLEKGGQTNDTLEQFKLALTFYVTTLATDLNPEKPFNPILGETFQGIIGGCPVYIEQVSHHPPMAAFQMEGKNFTINGAFEFNAGMCANSVRSRKIGNFKVTYKNTNTAIQVQFPTGVMSGTAFGKRVWQYSKKLQVYDLNNNYYAEVDFDKSENSKKRKELPGYFSNNIYKTNEKFSNKIKQESQKSREVEIKFKEKDHSISKLDQFEGSWLESMSFNNTVYWSQANPWPYNVQYFDNPLPSDSNFRLDILYLRADDELKAQDAKGMFEEQQRKDRKLREQRKLKQYH